jgi:hypothetical protein
VLYSYFKDAHREPDLNGGATLVLRTERAAVVVLVYPARKRHHECRHRCDPIIL